LAKRCLLLVLLLLTLTSSVAHAYRIEYEYGYHSELHWKPCAYNNYYVEYWYNYEDHYELRYTDDYELLSRSLVSSTLKSISVVSTNQYCGVVKSDRVATTGLR